MGVIVGGLMCVVFDVMGVQNVVVKSYGLMNLYNFVCVMLDGLCKQLILVDIVVKCGKFVEEILG